jgi:hypothetical protein
VQELLELFWGQAVTAVSAKISTITKQQHRKAVAAAATQFYEC